MSKYKDLTFYATQPHDCSYLPTQQATTLFMDPTVTLDQELCTDLAEAGFRRSGVHIYRPHCAGCQACIPIRIPVDTFMFSRTQRKTWNRNQRLLVNKKPAHFQDEHYQLYQRYISQCHQDGDMYPASVEQYLNFLVDAADFTSFYEFREHEELVAVAVVDHLQNSLSAVYTFYHPDYQRRSLGRYCILWLIAETKRQSLTYLHLGYWINGCRKMNYKLEYRPAQVRVNHQWQLLE